MTQGCDNEVETLQTRLDKLEQHVKINTEKQIGSNSIITISALQQ